MQGMPQITSSVTDNNVLHVFNITWQLFVAFLLVLSASSKATAGAFDYLVGNLNVLDILAAAGLSISLCLLATLILAFGRHRFAWQVTAVVFVAFMASSIWSWARRETSCGCFGSISVSPSATLFLDLIVFAGAAPLAILLPRHAELAADWRAVVYRSFGVTSSVILLSIVAVVVDLSFGARVKYSANLSDSVRTQGFPDYVNVVIPIRNLSSSPARLVGLTQSCGIGLSEDLPLTLDPSVLTELHFVAKLPRGASRGQLQVDLWIDDGSLYKQRLDVKFAVSN